jgi:hypothetical protein
MTLWVLPSSPQKGPTAELGLQAGIHVVFPILHTPY